MPTRREVHSMPKRRFCVSSRPHQQLNWIDRSEASREANDRRCQNDCVEANCSRKPSRQCPVPSEGFGDTIRRGACQHRDRKKASADDTQCEKKECELTGDTCAPGIGALERVYHRAAGIPRQVRDSRRRWTMPVMDMAKASALYYHRCLLSMKTRTVRTHPASGAATRAWYGLASEGAVGPATRHRDLQSRFYFEVESGDRAAGPLLLPGRPGTFAASCPEGA
jgi:hypothetical protein